MRLPGVLFKHRYKSLLSIFKRGSESELRAMLWQLRSPKIKYMDLTVSTLQKIQPPKGQEHSLKIERVYSTWNFDLVIFYTPWNELHGYLTKRAQDQIFELGKIWIFLTMRMQGFLK